MLVLDFVANSRLKNNQWHLAFLWNPWECLNKDTQKKKEKSCFLYIGGSDNQIVTYATLPNITYKFYGFSDDLIEIIN